MKNLLLSLFLIPAFAFAQDKSESFFQLSVGADMPKQTGDAALSVRLAGGVNLGNTVFVGAGVGITKFDNLKGPYIPVYLNLGFAMDASKKLFPFVLFQPGMGIYNSEKLANGQVASTTKGGPTFYAGGGVGLSSSQHVKITATAGYSQYGFKTNEVKSHINGFAFRVSLLIL